MSVDLLLSQEAAGMLGAALGEDGAELIDLRLADVRVQPGGAARARYFAQVRRADGHHSRESLVAVTGATIPEGAVALAGEHHGSAVEVGVWRWPRDPVLPALRVAEHPRLVAERLADLGLPVAAAPQVTVRAYRPGQRAVLEVHDGRRRYFLKVVRPAAVADLCLRHRLLAGRSPVPPVLGHSPDGLIVLAEAPGTLLRDELAADRDLCPGDLPAPSDLESLLDELPAELLTLDPRRSILHRVRDSVEVLSTCAHADPAVAEQVAHDLTDAAERIADTVLQAPPASAPSPVPVHGDFYHAQLLTQGSRITALLDVDTAGPGERADEWATLLGHLSVLGLTHAPARRYCSTLFAHARRRIDPDQLSRRTATVILGLAVGPFRHRAPDWPAQTAQRLALASHWLSR